MTKLEFMKELESLLPDIPLEERDEALQYYNGYFDDAGEDQEQEIIKELGSPTKVAAIIKADLTPGSAERENRGYFTEKGYQETIRNEYEIAGTAKKESSSNEQAGNGFNTNANGNTNNAYVNYVNQKNANRNSAYHNNANHNNANAYNSNNSYTNGAYTNGNADQTANKTTSQGTKNSNTGLIVVVALLTFPFWLPLLISAFGIIIGVVAAILGIIFGFGVAGITMIGVGIALFIAGLVQISVPFIGLILIGGGLIILGIGMLLTLACVALCKNVLPAMVRGIVNLCRLPFKNRSVMA